MERRKVSRKKAKIKMSISAPTGWGKTMGALKIAYGMVKDWTKITVLDTENQSADLYEHLGDYNVVTMQPPYTVESFQKAVKMCVDSGDLVIIVDSTYHFWHGKGGLLDYVGSLGGRFADWAKGTPLWQTFLDTILQTDCHFICTSRKKQAYEITKNAQGKSEVEKKGMEDQVRDGFDYEMTIAFDIISANHMVKTNKDRTEMFTGKQEFVISEETGEMIAEWCEKGIDFKPKPTATVTNAAVEKAVEREKGGESGVFDKLIAGYALTEVQIKIIDDYKASIV